MSDPYKNRWPRLDPRSQDYADVATALQLVDEQPPSARVGNHAHLIMVVSRVIGENVTNKEEAILIARYLTWQD